MSLLTEQEIQDLCYVELDRLFDEVAFARAIEAKVISKTKAQGRSDLFWLIQWMKKLLCSTHPT